MERDARECWMTQRQVVLSLTGWQIRSLKHRLIVFAWSWRSFGQERGAIVPLDEHSVCRIGERKTCLTSTFRASV